MNKTKKKKKRLIGDSYVIVTGILFFPPGFGAREFNIALMLNALSSLGALCWQVSVGFWGNSAEADRKKSSTWKRSYSHIKIW